jgi:hypothetical protein
LKESARGTAILSFVFVWWAQWGCTLSEPLIDKRPDMKEHQHLNSTHTLHMQTISVHHGFLKYYCRTLRASNARFASSFEHGKGKGLHFEKAKDCTRVSVRPLSILQAKQRIALQSFVE